MNHFQTSTYFVISKEILKGEKKVLTSVPKVKKQLNHPRPNLKGPFNILNISLFAAQGVCHIVVNTLAAI